MPLKGLLLSLLPEVKFYGMGGGSAVRPYSIWWNNFCLVVMRRVPFSLVHFSRWECAALSLKKIKKSGWPVVTGSESATT
jgi:hypothetical protein